MSAVESLRSQWTQLYSKTLPQLARAHDPAQLKWPVSLDHCFARIILDNTVGEGSQQWDKIVKKPAVRNMTEQQLKDAIDLGEKIKAGEMDLRELDQISLMCRGKNPGKYGASEKGYDPKPTAQGMGKRKQVEAVEKSATVKKPKLGKQQSTLQFERSPTKDPTKHLHSSGVSDDVSSIQTAADAVDFKATLQRIQDHPSLTPYRRRLYTILLSVPRGKHTTYAAMSDYLNSSARAVGNGMRHNPFAPDVPCHRVLAADGSLGGFNGSWGRDGTYASQKIQLLRSEGVRFDVKGRVVGEPFRKFHEFEDLYKE